MIDATFLPRRLRQLPHLGIRMGCTVEAGGVSMPLAWVSTVCLGDLQFTRVEAVGCETEHFPGLIESYAAARRFWGVETDCRKDLRAGD